MSEVTSNRVELSETVEIPWNRLRKSNANVRVVKPDNDADAALIANIAETGVIFENLIVTPLADEDGCYGVHAGGRRWSAVGENVKQGVFPDTFPVPCRIQTSGSLTAVSLAENHLQAPMHPADEFKAFDDMAKEGADVATIAAHFGMPEQRIRQRLRLGQVSKRILDAYRREQIDLQTVMAFTLAPSQKEQLRVFNDLGDHCHAFRVRQAFTGDTSIKSDDRLVKYVGIEAYQAEGGALVADLFAEHDHLQDRELVERLALAKLEQAAARLKAKEGWADVRVTTEHYFPVHEYHHIEPEAVGVPEATTARLEQLIKDQNALHEMDADWTPELEAQDEQLTEAIEALEDEIDGYRAYTDEQKAKAFCFITISNAGKTQIARGYLSRAAARQDKAKAGSEDGVTAMRSIPQALVTDLGHHRQQAAQAALMDDPNLASDVLLYTLCYDVLHLGYARKALNLRAEIQTPMGSVFEETVAAAAAKKVQAKLPTEWMSIECPTERFAALRKLTPKRKQALLTYCVSVTFTTGVAGEDSVTEAALEALAPDYTKYWRPTGEGYFKRLRRDALLALGTELFGDDWQTEHQNDKKGELIDWLDRFFVGPKPKGLSAEHEAIRNDWLPAEFVKEPQS